MYRDEDWWKNISKSDINQLNSKDKLEAALREFCNQKRGLLGFCGSASHRSDVEQIYPIMKDLGLM